MLLMKSLFNDFGGVSSHNGIRFDIFGYHSPTTYHCPISYLHSGHNHGFAAYPDIVTYYSVSGSLKAILTILESFNFGHIVNRETRNPVITMSLMTCHDEAYSTSNGAEGTYKEFIYVVSVREDITVTIIQQMAVLIAGMIRVFT